MLLKDIWKDVKAVQERDPAARGAWEVLVLCQGVHALIWHRIAHWFWLHHMKFVGRLISQLARFFTLIEIHPGATLGHGILIDHGCRSSGQSREDRRRSSAGHKKDRHHGILLPDAGYDQKTGKPDGRNSKQQPMNPVSQEKGRTEKAG